MEIIEIKEQKSKICETILKALPDWFGIESAVRDYVLEVKNMPMFAAKNKNNIIGFISLKFHNANAAEIYVMGVLKNFHKQGIGKQLVLAAEKYLFEKQVRFFTVKTLSQSRDSAVYERTRKFYLAMGFQPIEEFKNLWGSDNPCLYMIKVLKPFADL
ncbi:MAG: GNAT family N-acetyltransferase [Elusimicrobia bacterium]|nr:GNAT family N-acetyltransferase [Elusimicrobiota bacterium]